VGQPQSGEHRSVTDDVEGPLDAETVAGIINLLMRIDARLEALLELFVEDDGEEEPDA
jgi:hypothetical protein